MNKVVKQFYDLAFDYHMSASSLWVQIVSKPFIYNPTIYLLRHTTELLLKGLIVNKNLKIDSHADISQIYIQDNNNAKKNINSTHSLLCLWNGFKQLNKNHRLLPLYNARQERFIDSQIKAFDEKDVSSTTYRYPYDKYGKSMIIEPLQIDDSDIAPEIGKRPPKIVKLGDRIYIIKKGFRYINQVQNLFDVVKLLFDFYDLK